MTLKLILLLTCLAHVLCGACDCLLSYTPKGRIDLKCIKDPEKMTAGFEHMPLKYPLLSMLLGVVAIAGIGFGYLMLTEWMRQFSQTAATVMFIGVVLFMVPGIAHHVFFGVVEWFYVRLSRTNEARAAVLEFMRQTISTMFACYLGLALFAITLLVMVVTGQTTLPQWACVFNTVPLFLLLLLTKLPAQGNIAGALMMLGLAILI